MHEEDLDLEAFMKAIVIPNTNITFLRTEPAADPERQSCWSYYKITSASGATKEAQVGVEWAADKRVIHFSIILDFRFVDTDDEAEMQRLSELVYQFNRMEWLVGRVLAISNGEDGPLELQVSYPMFIPPFDRNFTTSERLSAARIFVGYNLNALFEASDAVAQGLMDNLRRSSATEFGEHRSLQ
jgi:hypothetical protein